MSRGSHDRVGLTWHPALAASILSHGHRLDIVEVIPEGTFLDSRKARRALRTLSRQIPVAIHGVSLGFASAAGVEARRLEAFARLVDEIEPEHWSDHLAFVRAGGVELGHLAAPSRTALTVEATAENLDRATRLVGRIPLVENVASLIDPPASDRTEEAWLHDLLDASACDLLLDLHNLVTNGRNFGYDPAALVEGLPAHRIRAVHIAGGSELEAATGDRRVLDDHRHDVPDSVYRLLELVAARVPHPIDVVLERDGAFPPFEQLLGELDRARAALATGRAMRRAAADAVAAAAPADGGADGRRGPTGAQAGPAPSDGITRDAHAGLERLLARLFTDEAFRAQFLADPVGEGCRAGLDGACLAAVERIDRPGLELASVSFARKRAAGRRG